MPPSEQSSSRRPNAGRARPARQSQAIDSDNTDDEAPSTRGRGFVLHGVWPRVVSRIVAARHPDQAEQLASWVSEEPVRLSEERGRRSREAHCRLVHDLLAWRARFDSGAWYPTRGRTPHHIGTCVRRVPGEIPVWWGEQGA
jgi:hypothetical protein